MRQHGTHACYVWGPNPGAGDGCRCDDCRKAAAEYERERKRRKAPPYVGADRARQHVRELMAAGVGLRQITRLTGISGGVLCKLMYGQGGRPPSKRIRKATEDRLLAVSPADTADGAKVPAGPTHAIVEQLVERGWTKVAIAREIGQTGVGLQLGTEFVTAGHARVIKALLDKPVPARRSRWGLHEIDPIEDDDAAPDVRPDYELPTFADEGDTTWMTRAACRLSDVPTWMFFPPRGDHRGTEAAKAVCATCPAAKQCCDYAVRTGQRDGVWGGRTARQRRHMGDTDLPFTTPAEAADQVRAEVTRWRPA